MMRPWNCRSRFASELATVVMSTSTSTAVIVVPDAASVPCTSSVLPVASASWPKRTSLARYWARLPVVTVQLPSMPVAVPVSVPAGSVAPLVVVVEARSRAPSRVRRSAGSSCTTFR